MLQEYGMWIEIKNVVEYDWICELTEACAINRGEFAGLGYFEAVRLYSATLRKFVEYWTRASKKARDMKGDGDGRSLNFKKSLARLEKCGPKEY
jgi:hypothetical protein